MRGNFPFPWFSLERLPGSRTMRGPAAGGLVPVLPPNDTAKKGFFPSDSLTCIERVALHFPCGCPTDRFCVFVSW